jgi:hypothetical protein
MIPTAGLNLDFRPAKYALACWREGDTTADVILVRVDDPASGKIWLIFERDGSEYPEALRPNGKRAADGS